MNLFKTLLATLAMSLPLLAAAPMASAQVSMSDEAGGAFRGTKKVAIAQFGVEFYTQLMAVGRSGGNTPGNCRP